ncbi:class I SAM-dependent methyltransferase [Xanthomonas cassavae CFBP 4642]|uniref:Class I SAM-dependent methyltransferase n=1 Tax=Xanthomonas cassavae CFBP 4642 TaxID=1219375 RepID=A0ABS8HFD8_9XANT|nr:class I SAM-dependent methyltransferase [Xanthomonas cassavae]MCC4620061.1 class I SAM-dependent methyltransferase [Xanthomonas cassavae CFBP 4642]
MQDNDLHPGQSTSRGQLISHSTETPPQDEALLQAVRARLRATASGADAHVDELLALVDELWTFALGRFLLVSRGLNAEWTHQMVTHPSGSLAKESTPALQYALFESMPSLLATRERFGIFRQQLQALLRPGIVLASIPCGWMGELLLLDYRQCPGVRLIGVDLDPEALEGARRLASQHGLEGQLSLQLDDAWAPGEAASVDVLTSNGLNIYEPDEERVVALYGRFYDRLRPGGTLVTSALTPPPGLSPESPWNLDAIDAEGLRLQTLVLAEIVQVAISFRTHAQTREQLERAGFVDVRFIDDSTCAFPTVIARKPAD